MIQAVAGLGDYVAYAYHRHGYLRDYRLPGRIFAVQQLLGFDGGNAGDLESRHALERLNGSLSHLAEISGAGALEITKLLEPCLKRDDPVVLVAAAQHDIAAVFRRVRRKQPLLHVCGCHAALGEPAFALELFHSSLGCGIVA